MKDKPDKKNKALQDAEILIESYNNLFKRGTEMYLKEAIENKFNPEKSFQLDEDLKNQLNNDMEENMERLTGEEFNTEKEYNFYLLENMGRKIISGSTQEIHKVFKYRDKLYEEWNVTPVTELENITPEEFFNKIEDLDILIDIFRLYAIKSDYKMPDVFLQKLKSYGIESTDRIIKLAIYNISSHFQEMLITTDNIQDDIIEHITISLTAIEVLGSWKIEKAVMPLIGLLQRIPIIIYDEGIMDDLDKRKKDDIDGYKEMYRTNIRDALVSIGSSAIQPLIEILEITVGYNENHEYMLMALAEIGRENRSDRIYGTLKNVFLDIDNKIVGSSCLGVYGDGRAVTTLRGYVKKNLNNLDRETFYEIKKAVEDLGGNMDDIKFHTSLDSRLH